MFINGERHTYPREQRGTPGAAEHRVCKKSLESPQPPGCCGHTLESQSFYKIQCTLCTLCSQQSKILAGYVFRDVCQRCSSEQNPSPERPRSLFNAVTEVHKGVNPHTVCRRGDALYGLFDAESAVHSVN